MVSVLPPSPASKSSNIKSCLSVTLGPSHVANSFNLRHAHPHTQQRERGAHHTVLDFSSNSENMEKRIQDSDFYCEINHIPLFLSLHSFNHVSIANVQKPLQTLFWCLLKESTQAHHADTGPLPTLGWGSKTTLHTLEEKRNPQNPSKLQNGRQSLRFS